MLSPSPSALVLTKDQAAQALQVSMTTIHRMLKAGTLRSVKVGSRVLIPREAVNDFLDGKK